MSENTDQKNEQKNGGRLDGIAIGGIVLSKRDWPAKEGKKPSWSVELAYLGGKSFINVSETFYSTVTVGGFHMFLVSQNAKGDKIYSTAIERR